MSHESPTVPPRPTAPPTAAIDDWARIIHAKADLLRLIELVGRCRLVAPEDETQLSQMETDLVEESQNLLANVGQQLRRLGKAPAITAEAKLQAATIKQTITTELTYAQYAYVLKILAKQVRRTIVVIASKGGAGKTALITLLATLYAWLTGVATLLVEGNENDGTVNLRTNISRSSVNTKLTDAIFNRDLINTHKKGATNLGQHWQAPSLYVLLSDPDDSKNQFALQDVLTMLEAIDEQYCARFGDTGNGTGVTKTANTALLLRAHVVLLPVVADDMQTYHTLLTTMINLYNNGHQDKLQRFSRIVINGAKGGNAVERFMDTIYAIAVEKTSGKGEATQRQEWIGQPDKFLRDIGFCYDKDEQRFTGEHIFVVPYSQWIADGKPISILPEDIGQDTLTAGLMILCECLTMEVQTDEEMEKETTRVLAMANGEHQTPEDLIKQAYERLVSLTGGANEAGLYIASQV